jgi:uncharacterized membrane protein
MKIHHFLNQVEHTRIDEAIRAAEHKTTGRIVVYVGRHHVDDPVVEGRRLFQKLHLETEKNKAALLLFIAPKAQKFSVTGGTALHEKLGQKWWDDLAAGLAGHFRAGRYTEGLLAAIEASGQVLQAHFSATGHATHRSQIIEE